MELPKKHFNFIQHENSPIPTFLEIVRETEKAIQVETPQGRQFWLPLSALKESDTLEGVFTFKPWFKQKKDCPNIY